MKRLTSTVLALFACAAAAQADESLGQRLAQNSCAQCHSFARGEGHGVGPNLFGVFGRPAATASGFAFSKPYFEAMKGKSWDRALLERWLTDTQAVAPGSGMVYFQDDPKKRDELNKYLQSLK